MSGIRLAAPYLDTSADQLSFTLDQPARPALAVRDVPAGETTVQLRLLGASHQVFAGPVRETVACLPGTAGGLPPAVEQEVEGWNYRFTARVLHYRRAEFADRVAALRERLEGRREALCGVFPGSPDAVTALAVERRGAALDWRTWHTYPQSRQIVATHTRLEAR
ncbi:DUF2617 family protein [Streptomyces sp. TRM 70351]|uniref:DUF2617 family protein n=1 Tax=Streptomyces sp. TRM 70351 TaxID=3116552 RepID=UPI002E7B7F33|nr:DUF2617 family protein [Streptomyces sp. TRM 70351]MEE1930754.1 DUF2617 family protein [Streptomyces sp. TRM 70351]